MEDKIKTNISKETYSLLLRDCELFGFLKSKNREINLNAFLNVLIGNYFEDFINERDRKLSDLRDIAKKNNLMGKKIDNFLLESISLIEERKLKRKENYVPLAFRPSKRLHNVLLALDSGRIKNMTISSLFRQLFDNYSRKLQSERELIVFKDIAKRTEECIQRRRTCLVYTEKNKTERDKEMMPYALCSNPEQSFNYLVGIRESTYMKFRLSQIKEIIERENKAIFSKDDISLIERARRYGPQYTYTKNDPLIRIRLTKEGEKLYENLYVYRPQYLRKEEDIYIFETSYDQTLNYFARFGKECEILSPLYMRNEMKRFYLQGYESYND